MEQTNEELESFRRQWLEEVSARTRATHASRPEQQQQQQQQQPKPSSGQEEPSRRRPPQAQYVPQRQDDDEEDGGASAAAPPDFENLSKKVRSMSISSHPEESLQSGPHVEPKSALEHFEQAARKEALGNLGDSLELYRKAYRLDSKVDQTYRKKHFPPAATLRVPSVNPSNGPMTVPNTAHQSSETPTTLPTPELIASFARLPIPRADPVIEGDIPPPCPIANVPSEILMNILKYVALRDPASMARVALVCKRLAYHVAHEQHIWRRLCQGPEFGFAGMHYAFACDLKGRPLHTLKPRYTPFPFGVPLEIPKPLTTWSQVFQTFPRIRFTGIYISTVNYARPGGASASQTSWNSPIHIVTYYRYLRFYPDGSLISLLTTTEPLDVVPHISKENLDIVRAGVSASSHRHHPSDTTSAPQPLANPIPTAAAAALKSALRGRWHLAKPPSSVDNADQPLSSGLATAGVSSPPPASTSKFHHPKTTDPSTPDLRDVFVETEGVDPKYTYTMHLSLRSTASGGVSSKGGVGQVVAPSNTSKNTRLVWKGFWSYNRLTDDWAEFGLRNDRAFVFRRVRGWGMNN
ncbi:hypothetical protein VTO42DRAFT_2368 [Malbranchea cinnamomea]